MPFRATAASVAMALTLLAAACSEPPTREMHQAQGAIDAARAAGAAEYAPEEFKAAQDALVRYQDAVAQSDYRLALNHALDSLERAQNAAKMAADRKATARSDAERQLDDVTTALAAADEKLKQAEAARVPAARLTAIRRSLDPARQAVQEARSQLQAEGYLAARDALAGVAPIVRDAITQLDAALGVQPGRRRP